MWLRQLGNSAAAASSRNAYSNSSSRGQSCLWLILPHSAEIAACLLYTKFKMPSSSRACGYTVVETVVIINLGIHLTKYTEYRWWLIFTNYLGRVLQCFPHVYLNSLHNSKKKVLLLVLFCRQRSSNWKGTDIGLLASQFSGDIQTYNKGFGDPASYCLHPNTHLIRKHPQALANSWKSSILFKYTNYDRGLPWLRCCTPRAGGLCSDPGQGTKIPHATTKTQTEPNNK